MRTRASGVVLTPSREKDGRGVMMNGQPRRGRLTLVLRAGTVHSVTPSPGNSRGIQSLQRRRSSLMGLPDSETAIPRG